MAKRRSSTYRPVALDRDRARPRTSPAPSPAQMTQRLSSLLTPLISRQQVAFQATGLRTRQLGLPVMVGVVLALVWRQIASVSELMRLLEREPVLWVPARTVSQQAMSKRLRTFPAALFAAIAGELAPVLQDRARQRPPACPPLLTRLQQDVGAIWAVDGSALEAVGRLSTRGDATPAMTWSDLGGRIEAVVDLVTRVPVTLWWCAEANANDRRFLGDLQAILPPRTLLVLDRGFSSFAWFDWLTTHDHRYVTRPRRDARFTVIETLTETATVRDRLVQLGAYRSSPCHAPSRLIEVRRGETWHAYLTNWLDPATLAPEEAAAVYAERWRIEETFLQTKRLLHMSYLWSADPNAIQLQVWATWILYGVLVDLCGDLATRLAQPLARISTEMVLRGLYHYAKAVEGGYGHDPVTYLADPANADLGIVKRLRPSRTTPAIP